MLNYNQRLTISFKDFKIMTARRHNAFAGLGNYIPPKDEKEQRELDRIKALMTYDEVKATGTKTPYKQYIRQFI